jgi:hypothetical protein
VITSLQTRSRRAGGKRQYQRRLYCSGPARIPARFGLYYDETDRVRYSAVTGNDTLNFVTQSGIEKMVRMGGGVHCLKIPTSHKSKGQRHA